MYNLKKIELIEIADWQLPGLVGGLRGKRKGAEINEGGQKVQIFSYKTNKSWGYSYPGDTVGTTVNNTA